MRSYIFTDSECLRLKRWLLEDVEDTTTRMIFVGIRHNMDRILSDIKLYTLVCRKLRIEGRYMGRPKEFALAKKLLRSVNARKRR